MFDLLPCLFSKWSFLTCEESEISERLRCFECPAKVNEVECLFLSNSDAFFFF